MHCAREIGEKKIKKKSPKVLRKFLFNFTSSDLHALEHPSNAHWSAPKDSLV